MIGKMKIVAIVLSLVIVSSAATLVMGGEQEREKGCKKAPKTLYKVHIAEVEALYDHEVYLLITSENGEPVCGFVEFFPPRLKEKEFREEWEDREYREDEDQEKRESKDDDEKDREYKEEEYEDEEDEEREEWEEEGEEEREDEENVEREYEEEDEEDEEDEEREDREDEEEEKDREDREENEKEREEEEKREKERREHYRKKEERKILKKRGFRFKEGKGRFLLFPSSHRRLGTTALITIRSNSEVKITPFIVVKETDVVIFPDSKDSEGHYCEIERSKRGIRFGFEDQMGDLEYECDWDYDDVVLYISRPFRKEYRYKQEMETKQKEKR
jgi:hypothetical protein